MQLKDLFDEIPMSEGTVVPLALKQLLSSELNVCDDWARAEKLLKDALEMIPDQLVIRVALYKMYAYSNRLEESLAMIGETLKLSAEQGGFAPEWQLQISDDSQWRDISGVTRCYLYTLKAMGFVRLRQGETMMACEVLDKLAELDPNDQVGGSVVHGMAQRILEQELDDVA